MALQRLDDGLSRVALVNEEGQRGHVEGEPLGLPSPVQEGLAQNLELRGCELGLLQRLSLQDLANRGLALLPSRVLTVPVECWR